MINNEKKKRRGRPVANDTRRYIVNVRVNLHELLILKRACNTYDLSMSNYIRMLIRDSEN